MVWFNRIVGTFLVLVLIALLGVWAFSPWLSRTVINSSLDSLGLSLTEASTIRLNPFSSKLTVAQLVLTLDNQAVVELDEFELRYRLLPLFKKHIHVSQISLDGFRSSASVDEQSIRVAGLDLNDLPSSSDENPDETKIDENEQPKEFPFTVVLPKIDVTDINIEFEHNAQQHDISLAAALIENVTYSNTDTNAAAEGALQLAGGRVNFKVSLNTDETLTTFSALVDAKGINLAHFQYLDEGLTALEGLLDAEISLDATQSPTELNVDVAEANIELNKFLVSQPDLSARLDTLLIELQNTAISALEDGSISAATDALVQVRSASARNSGSQNTVAAIGSLDADMIEVRYTSEQTRVSISEVTASTITVSEFEQDAMPRLALLDSLTISGTQFSDDSLEIDEIVLGKLLSELVIDSSGLANLLIPESSLASSDGTAAEDQPAESANKEPSATDINPSNDTVTQQSMRVVIHKIRNTDRAQIRVNDQTQKPTFAKTFYIDELQLSDIDTNDSSKPVLFVLRASDEAYMKFALSGQAEPFGESVNATIQSDLKEFSLPEANTYLAKTLGFEFKAGQLDTELGGSIVNNELDTKLTLVIRGSNFSASQKEDEVNLIGQTAVPLNVALGMLKDKQGNIKLTVPIRGDINDPEFGPEHLLALIVKKAVMRQTKNYLMTTFVPYAQVVNVALAAGSFALKVRFEDLPYASGQVEILEDQQSFVSQLTQLMQDKPKLQVKICPLAISGELTGIESDAERRESLLSIADQRAVNFKTAIVENGIDSSRLLVCGAKIDNTKGAKPRISFSI